MVYGSSQRGAPPGPSQSAGREQSSQARSRAARMSAVRVRDGDVAAQVRVGHAPRLPLGSVSQGCGPVSSGRSRPTLDQWHPSAVHIWCTSQWTDWCAVPVHSGQRGPYPPDTSRMRLRHPGDSGSRTCTTLPARPTEPRTGNCCPSGKWWAFLAPGSPIL